MCVTFTCLPTAQLQSAHRYLIKAAPNPNSYLSFAIGGNFKALITYIAQKNLVPSTYFDTYLSRLRIRNFYDIYWSHVPQLHILRNGRVCRAPPPCKKLSQPVPRNFLPLNLISNGSAAKEFHQARRL